MAQPAVPQPRDTAVAVADGTTAAADPADSVVVDELTALFVRIRAHGGGRQIESYPRWLFAVELDLRF